MKPKTKYQYPLVSMYILLITTLYGPLKRGPSLVRSKKSLPILCLILLPCRTILTMIVSDEVGNNFDRVKCRKPSILLPPTKETGSLLPRSNNVSNFNGQTSNIQTIVHSNWQKYPWLVMREENFGGYIYFKNHLNTK